MQLTPPLRIQWYKDEAFEFEIEPHHEVVFLHIGITKWSKTIVKRSMKYYKKLNKQCQTWVTNIC